jgi:hypothetical protein
METVTDSLGSLKRDPLSIIQLTHQRAQGSGLRARLRLEQRLLRSKDGSGFWRGPDSVLIISVISDDVFSNAVSQRRRSGVNVVNIYQ